MSAVSGLMAALAAHDVDVVPNLACAYFGVSCFPMLSWQLWAPQRPIEPARLIQQHRRGDVRPGARCARTSNGAYLFEREPAVAGVE